MRFIIGGEIRFLIGGEPMYAPHAGLDLANDNGLKVKAERDRSEDGN